MPKPVAKPQPDLRILFVDMNAFFASVEKMDDPDLHDRPVVVTPIDAPTGCCIACSYEARAQGVRTGCMVREAKKLIPDVVVARARPDRYLQVHHQILDAVDTVIPVSEVMSIDEFWCELMLNERPRAAVDRIAASIKAAIWSRVGRITCSIGVASNTLLAKVAAGMNKPDGYTVIPRSTLPTPLLDLGLTDLPGISKGIKRRLRTAGILTVPELFARTPNELRDAWGSVLGVYWWHWLRGDELPGPKGHRRTVGHQHVLAPDQRSWPNARGVALRLLAKATQRMRSLDYVATRLSLDIRYRDGSSMFDWSPAPRTNDTADLNSILGVMWSQAQPGTVLQVGVRLEGLEPIDTQIPLFEHERQRRDLMRAIDEINQRGGADTIYLGSMHDQRRTAPRRIPFGKPPDPSLPDDDGSQW